MHEQVKNGVEWRIPIAFADGAKDGIFRRTQRERLAPECGTK